MLYLTNDFWADCFGGFVCQYEEFSQQNTVNVDGFLFDDDDIDELCEQGVIHRNYCADCHSKNI